LFGIFGKRHILSLIQDREAVLIQSNGLMIPRFLMNEETTLGRGHFRKQNRHLAVKILIKKSPLRSQPQRGLSEREGGIALP